MEKVKLSPPWISFFREVEALFQEDPEVVIRYVDGSDCKSGILDSSGFDTLTWDHNYNVQVDKY